MKQARRAASLRKPCRSRADGSRAIAEAGYRVGLLRSSGPSRLERFARRAIAANIAPSHTQREVSALFKPACPRSAVFSPTINLSTSPCFHRLSPRPKHQPLILAPSTTITTSAATSELVAYSYRLSSLIFHLAVCYPRPAVSVPRHAVFVHRLLHLFTPTQHPPGQCRSNAFPL